MESFCSNSSREMRGFIFNRLLQTDNQKTLYSLRLISKSEQERVEKKIQTAKIDFGRLENFATSEFSKRIKFLEVCLRVQQDSFESFKYLSNTYLPYAQNINAKVYPSFHEDKIKAVIGLEMREPLTFRSVHILNYSNLLSIRITGKYNVEIWDCEFIGTGVYCNGNANVYVTGSKFIKGSFGLIISECDSVHIDKITLDNCGYDGLIVRLVKEVINITNVRVFTSDRGILLSNNTANFKLSNTIIKDCINGIGVVGPCGSGEIQKTNIEGCGCGIYLYHGAIVHYAAVEFKRNKIDVLIHDDDSQFLQLENIQ